jgi:hypothetical protein
MPRRSARAIATESWDFRWLDELIPGAHAQEPSTRNGNAMATGTSPRRTGTATTLRDVPHPILLSGHCADTSGVAGRREMSQDVVSGGQEKGLVSTQKA